MRLFCSPQCEKAGLSKTGVSCRNLPTAVRGTIFLARNITRCSSHISPDSVGRCARFGFVFLGHTKSQDSYRTSRSVGRCAIFGFVLLGQKNHKMHIARCRSVGRCAIFGFVFIGQKIQDASRTSRPNLFGWSMCEIRFCISWPEKSQDSYRTSLVSSC